MAANANQNDVAQLESAEQAEIYARDIVATGNPERILAVLTAIIEKFPNISYLYDEVSEALVSLGRFEEADRTLIDAMSKFPDLPSLGSRYAMSAHHRRDWSETCRRWELYCQLYPTYSEGYVRWADTLVNSHRVIEAEVVLDTAQKLYPDKSNIAAAQARLAQSQCQFDDALKRWENVRLKFPFEVLGFCGGAENLRLMGRLQEAEDLLSSGINAFGTELQFLREHATVASRRQDWSAAFARWDKVHKLFPNIDIDSNIGELLTLWRLACDEGDANAMTAILPPDFAARLGLLQAVASGVQGSDEILARELMLRFEGLGDHCEFGLVQRHFGAEPLSLLRWSGIKPDCLATALAAKFDGVGEAENTYIRVHDQSGEYFAGDKRWFFMHTFIRASELSEENAYKKICQRLRYLRGKLLEDLESASKIFVYSKCGSSITDDEIQQLKDAFNNNYPNATLLIVQLANNDFGPGCVRTDSHNCLFGYVDKFGDLGQKFISYQYWEQVCRNAASLTSILPK